jgi:hypothetical protein
MKKTPLILVLAVLAAVAVGYLAGRGGLRPAQAQGMVGEAQTTIAIIGPERNARLPILLIDTREQTLCIYEYDINSDSLEFTAARTYQWDKKLEKYGKGRGASPEEVRRFIQNRR